MYTSHMNQNDSQYFELSTDTILIGELFNSWKMH